MILLAVILPNYSLLTANACGWQNLHTSVSIECYLGKMTVRSSRSRGKVATFGERVKERSQNWQDDPKSFNCGVSTYMLFYLYSEKLEVGRDIIGEPGQSAAQIQALLFCFILRQMHIQTLESFQWRRFCNFPRQLLHCLIVLAVWKFLLRFDVNLQCCSLNPLPCVLHCVAREKNTSNSNINYQHSETVALGMTALSDVLDKSLHTLKESSSFITHLIFILQSQIWWIDLFW